MRDEALFVIDKPAGPTSFDIVRSVKRSFRGEKVGHAGSLDPFATGVLVVLLGRATKLSNALLNADKIYTATVLLGQATDSLDVTGNVTETAQIPSNLNLEKAQAVLKSFVGEWHQTPPMFSAKKIQGVRLYELARKSIEVPREKVPVQLFSLELVSLDLPKLTFRVHCSKGTYVRSLADELARALGTVGHLIALRREACGPFQIGEAITLEQLAQDPVQARIAGYDQFVRLLRLEGVVRQKPRGPWVPRGEDPQLPRRFNNDSSSRENLISV